MRVPSAPLPPARRLEHAGEEPPAAVHEEAALGVAAEGGAALLRRQEAGEVVRLARAEQRLPRRQERLPGVAVRCTISWCAIYNGVLYDGAPFNGALYIIVHH